MVIPLEWILHYICWEPARMHLQRNSVRQRGGYVYIYIYIFTLYPNAWLMRIQWNLTKLPLVLPFCKDDEYVPPPPPCTCHATDSPTPTPTPSPSPMRFFAWEWLLGTRIVVERFWIGVSMCLWNDHDGYGFGPWDGSWVEGGYCTYS